MLQSILMSATRTAAWPAASPLGTSESTGKLAQGKLSGGLSCPLHSLHLLEAGEASSLPP